MRNIDESSVRWASQSKPAFGGISFYIIFLMSIVAYTILYDTASNFLNVQLLGIISAVTIGFLLGLSDDAYNTRPILKFLAQFSCGIILIVTGTFIHLFDSTVLNYVFTCFWVVGMMNSLNMLDNMDGITTIVSKFISLAIIIALVFRGVQESIFLMLLIGVIAALIGFLYYNYNPSKMYMGDTGSQFLGIFLAAMSILFLWNNPTAEEHTNSHNFISVAIVFLLPIVDTTTVVINRLKRGQSPFVGGKDHTTHNLYYIGFSEKKVFFIFSSIAIISIVLLCILLSIKEWNTLFSAIFSLYCITIFTILYYPTIKRKG